MWDDRFDTSFGIALAGYFHYQFPEGLLSWYVRVSFPVEPSFQLRVEASPVGRQPRYVHSQRGTSYGDVRRALETLVGASSFMKRLLESLISSTSVILCWSSGRYDNHGRLCPLKSPIEIVFSIFNRWLKEVLYPVDQLDWSGMYTLIRVIEVRPEESSIGCCFKCASRVLRSSVYSVCHRVVNDESKATTFTSLWAYSVLLTCSHWVVKVLFDRTFFALLQF